MDYSSPYSDDLGPDPGLNLIPGYQPYIADVGITAKAQPFPVVDDDYRSESELARVRHSIRHAVSTKEFEKPISLSDFCLIAPSKWDEEDSSDVECSVRLCLLV